MIVGPATRAAILGLLLVSLVGAPAFAVAPSHVRECDPSDPTFTKTFSINGYSHIQIITLSSCGGYYDQAKISGKLVNFTNISLKSAANPGQSFGIGVRNMNATIQRITSTVVAFSSSAITNTTFTIHMPKLFFYYLKASGIPSNVTIDSTQILAASYFTTIGPFNSCAAPCAFVNSANNTMIVKPTAVTPMSASFCLSVCASSPLPVNATNIDLWVFVIFCIAIIGLGLIALFGKGDYWILFGAIGFMVGILFVASLANYGGIILSYAETGLAGTTTSIWPLGYIPLFFTILDVFILIYKIGAKIKF